MLAQRQIYRLLFVHSNAEFVIRTLTRGEIFQSYLTLGYGQMEIPPQEKSATAALELEIYNLGCLESSLEIPLAGFVTVVATEILRLSGFLENTIEQSQMLEAAAVYARTSEARGDSLIMATYSHYGLEELHSMTNKEWSRLLFSALTYQTEINEIPAQAFLLGHVVKKEAGVKEQSDPGLSPEFIRSTFGLKAEHAVVAGGGVITPGSHKTWGKV